MPKPQIQREKPDDRADAPEIDRRIAGRIYHLRTLRKAGRANRLQSPATTSPDPGRKPGKLLRWGPHGWRRAGGAHRRRVSGGRWEETDDAYVQADSMVLSTDVSGIVASIPVHEGEAVTKGQILYTLDPGSSQSRSTTRGPTWRRCD